MDGEISAEELRALLEGEASVRVVDIRPPGAFRRGHIPGSENVPFGELTSRIEEVADADRVVTVCPHGQASQQAARLVSSFEGFSGRVDSLEPGIEGWPYELETDDGAAERETAGATAGRRSDDGRSGDDAGDEGPEAPF